MSRLAEALKRSRTPEPASSESNAGAVPAPVRATTAPEPFVAFEVEAAGGDPESTPMRSAAPVGEPLPLHAGSAEPHSRVSDPVHDLASHGWFEGVAPTRANDHGRKPSELPRFATRLQRKLVVDPMARPVAVEQYRRLAAALHHSQAQFGTKVVMVASAVQFEGKSLSVSNLALTLSHSYRRQVLLIDADLRRPSIQEIFQLPVTTGLSEALRGTVEVALPLFEVSPRLTVLPSGRPDRDPIGGFASERMTRLVAEAASAFDWVLIDTPPLALVPDAKVLGAMVDAVVLVILAGKSPCELVRQSIEALGAEKIFGVVLNAAEPDDTQHAAQDGYHGSAGR